MKPKPLPPIEVLNDMLDYSTETGYLFWKCDRTGGVKSGHKAGSKNSRGYINVGVNGKIYAAHRIIWKMYYGYEPEEIDHINGVRTDNRISNLRVCTRSQNIVNRGPSGSSGIKGVHNVRGRWIAQISIRGKSTYIGTFDCKHEAGEAFKRESEKINGDYSHHISRGYKNERENSSN